MILFDSSSGLGAPSKPNAVSGATQADEGDADLFARAWADGESDKEAEGSNFVEKSGDDAKQEPPEAAGDTVNPVTNPNSRSEGAAFNLGATEGHVLASPPKSLTSADSQDPNVRHASPIEGEFRTEAKNITGMASSSHQLGGAEIGLPRKTDDPLATGPRRETASALTTGGVTAAQLALELTSRSQAAPTSETKDGAGLINKVQQLVFQSAGGLSIDETVTGRGEAPTATSTSTVGGVSSSPTSTAPIQTRLGLNIVAADQERKSTDLDKPRSIPSKALELDQVPNLPKVSTTIQQTGTPSQLTPLAAIFASSTQITAPLFEASDASFIPRDRVGASGEIFQPSAQVTSAQILTNGAPFRPAVAAVAQQMAIALGQSQTGSTQIALNPEELGLVRLSLSSSDAGLVINIFAERSETNDLLRRNIDSLLQEFSDLGYENPTFSFDQDAEANPRETSSQKGSGGQAMDDDPISEPQIISHLITSTGGLDLKL